jgi:hypothetical protein
MMTSISAISEGLPAAPCNMNCNKTTADPPVPNRADTAAVAGAPGHVER